MKKSVTITVAAALLAVFSTGIAKACSSVLLTAADGTRVIGRTWEYGVDIHVGTAVYPRGMVYESPAIDGTPGVHWKSKYSYWGAFAYHALPIVVDGLNEKGLSMDVLGYNSVYPEMSKISPKQRKIALANIILGDYILGNFSTVAEVKEALQRILVYGYPIPQAHGYIFPVHIRVDDAAGNTIVIEWDKGVQHIYSDSIGVMTNDPGFPYQMANLSNYIYLTNTTVENINFGGLNKQLGVSSGKKLPGNAANYAPPELASAYVSENLRGNGLLGLPGDYTAESRFVRLAVLKHFGEEQDQPQNAVEAIVLARHILDNVDTVLGTIVTKDAQGKIVYDDETQWTVFKDLTNPVVYYYTYNNPFAMWKIDLRKLSFTGTKPLLIPFHFSDPSEITNLTGQNKE